MAMSPYPWLIATQHRNQGWAPLCIQARSGPNRCCEDEQRTLNNELRVAKKRLKARGSFNAEFWAWSSDVDRGWIKF